MAEEKPEVLVLGPAKTLVIDGLKAAFTVHRLPEKDADAALTELAPRLAAIAITSVTDRVDAKLMARLPKLEIISTFGVGYDHIDSSWAGAHGIAVTNTPDVLTEEVADTAIGLLLCTAREFVAAERFVRAGKWLERGYPLSRASLRNRTVGLVGMGRIGKAIARRLDGMAVPVVYHARRPAEVPYRHYPSLIDMAHAVDVLLVIVPGGAETKNLIDRDVLEALGPDGILINMARGSVVDEPALIKALQDGTILTAGLDVFAHEPVVPAELIALDHVVLFPHLGSASVHTRTQMDQMVVDNLLAWAAGKPLLSEVPETLGRRG
ncbi:MAG TPA: 2-hydroxyacid dehydrogenase [Xanthobacteraceae bacterium]|jgi:lactate dehydrogenase-like 2-hydroxyacid dehydrogenase|nr:2-hydroxyacid dehydrogenase [Xanthobacteraceae bacterium]